MLEDRGRRPGPSVGPAAAVVLSADAPADDEPAALKAATPMPELPPAEPSRQLADRK
jgi:hypothetical protein